MHVLDCPLLDTESWPTHKLTCCQVDASEIICSLNKKYCDIDYRKCFLKMSLAILFMHFLWNITDLSPKTIRWLNQDKSTRVCCIVTCSLIPHITSHNYDIMQLFGGHDQRQLCSKCESNIYLSPIVQNGSNLNMEFCIIFYVYLTFITHHLFKWNRIKSVKTTSI